MDASSLSEMFRKRLFGRRCSVSILDATERGTRALLIAIANG
jgi:hypothetical protein